jgi:GTP-binding protein
MLIDDVIIKIKAGNGGRGAVAFNKTKGSRGPTGSNGGRGGSFYFEGISSIDALNQFRGKRNFSAENGENGKTKLLDGGAGEDLVLNIPVGTVIHNLTTGADLELVSIGQRILIAKGGRGGKGNFLFRSSTNTTPMEFQEGEAGEAFDLRLELKLIADVGLIGLPNVGKSSFLNKFTNAKSKVADYLFTTLEPNLGVYFDLILADIPGLIEGASEGKGLGIKFLRHIERTKILFHFIAADSKNPLSDYKIIREELKKHNKDLLDKKEYLFLSKSDMISKKEFEEKKKKLEQTGREVLPISIINDETLKPVEKILRKLIKEKHTSIF